MARANCYYFYQKRVCQILVACALLALLHSSSAAHTSFEGSAAAATGTDMETWTWSVQYGLLVSPVYSAAADAIYVMSKLGTLWAISMRTGKPIWRYRSHIVSPSKQVPQPLVSAGLPAAGCEDTVFIGGMHALNACNGALKWHSPVLGSNYSSPSAAFFRTSSDALEPPRGVLFVNTKEKYGTSFLRFVRADTGELALSRPLLGTKASHPVVATAVAGGVVFICTVPDLAHTGAVDSPTMKDGVLYAFSATAGKQLWRWQAKHLTAFLSAPATFPGSEALPGARVFVAHQNADDEFGVSALDAASGAVLWTTPLRARVAASPVVDEESGVLFYGSLAGVLGALDGAGRSLWSLQLAAALHASPTLGRENGRVYAGTTAGTVYCVDRLVGSIVWKYQAVASIVAPVLVVYANNTVVVGTSAGTVVRLESTYAGNPRRPRPPPARPSSQPSSQPRTKSSQPSTKSSQPSSQPSSNPRTKSSQPSSQPRTKSSQPSSKLQVSCNSSDL